MSQNENVSSRWIHLIERPPVLPLGRHLRQIKVKCVRHEIAEDIEEIAVDQRLSSLENYMT
jgi:hypothetical protein